MAAIDYLHAAGFSVRVTGERLVVSPASALTLDHRKYIKLHRLELLAEVAANDGEARRTLWRLLRYGKVIGSMVGPPITRAEALADVRARGWPDTDIE